MKKTRDAKMKRVYVHFPYLEMEISLYEHFAI